MDYTPFSPFKRPISLTHLQSVAPASQPISKWEVLRDLAKAQCIYGLKDRDLAVLQGLLSFHPSDTLDPREDLVVFASNRAICERLNGMPDSTMRRHLTKLVASGVVSRRDSPNGKRFRLKGGGEDLTFGLDLSPLPRLAPEIKTHAETFREAEAKIKRMRMRISLMRRDLLAICALGKTVLQSPLWEDAATLAQIVTISLRRKPELDALTVLSMRISKALEECASTLSQASAADLNTNDAQIELHHQKANEEEKILIPAGKIIEDAAPTKQLDTEAQKDPASVPPLYLVAKACPDLATFAGGTPTTWHQLFAAASRLCPALCIHVSTWNAAVSAMGAECASVVVSVILQRFSEIRSPGAYLRRLTTLAANREFSCIPMIGRLLERPSAT